MRAKSVLSTISTAADLFAAYHSQWIGIPLTHPDASEYIAACVELLLFVPAGSVCVVAPVAFRILSGMDARLEIRIAPAQRPELAARAAALGLSCSAFARRQYVAA